MSRGTTSDGASRPLQLTASVERDAAQVIGTVFDEAERRDQTGCGTG
ncbi:hypothetical protein [Streptomyces wuyuanensis]